MRDANSLVQHFNPACRTMRRFPHLPISRFLLSINDYDVPHFTNTAMPMKLQAWLGLVVGLRLILFVTSFLSVTTAIIAPLGDLAGDLVIVSVTEIIMIVIYYISEGSLVMGLVITLLVLSLPFVGSEYMGIQERRKSVV